MLRRLKSLTKALLFKSYIWMHRRLHRWSVLPASRNFGYERGKPVGRYYIEGFLRRNALTIKGRCLEFGEPLYKSYFPAAERYEVVSVVAGPQVDFVCDIHDCQGMPERAFDAVICTQVLEHLAWPEQAARSLYRLLKPGGVLLITVPFLCPVHGLPHDYRRFTPNAMDMILKQAGFLIEEVDYGGNSLVVTGMLLGMVVEDFTTQELDTKDPVYPYNVLIRARVPAQPLSQEHAN